MQVKDTTRNGAPGMGIVSLGADDMAGASSVDDGWASANDDGEGGDAGGGEEDEARPAPRLLGR